MATQNLEALSTNPDLVDILRNQQVGPNVYPGVPLEYTNWRDEQRGWQETAVLFNQSYHMVDLLVEGPDAFKMLNYLGINSFKGFTPGKAKQFVPVTWDGHVIGDVILCYLDKELFNLIGRPPVANWVQYHGETGKKKDGSKWNVKFERDERSASRPNPTARKTYRYQVQGPNAMKVMTKVLGATPPDLKFFNMTEVTIAGKKVTALRHGMAGQPGFELFGPSADGQAILDAIY